MTGEQVFSCKAPARGVICEQNAFIEYFFAEINMPRRLSTYLKETYGEKIYRLSLSSGYDNLLHTQIS